MKETAAQKRAREKYRNSTKYKVTRKRWKENHPDYNWHKKNTEWIKEYRTRNRDKILSASRENYQKNKEEKNKKRKIYHIREKYNISIEQFNQMRSEQLNKCAICLEEMIGNRNCSIDHNHDTGKVRELLCLNCNTALGKFRDNPHLLRRAVDYLCKWDYLHSRGDKNAK